MHTTTLAERARIGELAQAGLSDPQIAHQIGWRPSTVRKWRRCCQREGTTAGACPYGRPATGALSAFAPSLVGRLRDWRSGHPGWGAKTLRAQLQQTLAREAPLGRPPRLPA